MNRAVRAITGFLLGAASFALFSCRDDVAPFEANDRPPLPAGTTTQLTFSLKDDRSPAWTVAGDSVYYSAEGFGSLPADPGVLVGLPQEGGVAGQILTNVQIPGDGSESWLVAPAVAPDGERLAYVEIAPLWDIRLWCIPELAQLSCTPPDSPVRVELPLLRQVFVRVRRLAETGPVESDPRLDVIIPGVIVDVTQHPFGAPQLHLVDNHPFQQLYDEEQTLIFRASWAPEGDRLVVSDGLRLLLWTVDSGQMDTIPGSDDGSSPTWSPNGEWIAFTRLERADSSNSVCLFIALGVQCVEERTDYVPGRRVLSLIRPDGTGLTELGDGDEAAWSPDGEAIFFRRGGEIWRIAPDGTAAEPIPGTEGGREPAVSPDGRSLAFSRPGDDGDFDIWKVALVSQP